jgi:hypothetical protein
MNHMESDMATRKPKAEEQTASDKTEVVVVAPKPKIGRPSDYNPTTATIICSRIAAGESLREIVKTDGMPDRRTVYSWLMQHEEFLSQYNRAREEQADTYADEIIAIADEQPEIIAVIDKKTGALIEHKLDNAFLQWQRNRIDARKWTAMKLKPKKYGERLQMTGSKDEPMEVNARIDATSLFEGLMQNLELKKQVKISE